MHVLLKSVLSDSRETPVENQQVSNDTTPWVSIDTTSSDPMSFNEDPRISVLVLKFPLFTKEPITCFWPIFIVSMPLSTAMIHTILEREILGLERRSENLEREDFKLPLFLYSTLLYIENQNRLIQVAVCFSSKKTHKGYILVQKLIVCVKWTPLTIVEVRLTT